MFVEKSSGANTFAALMMSIIEGCTSWQTLQNGRSHESQFLKSIEIDRARNRSYVIL